MKRKFLALALVLAGVTGNLFAQQTIIKNAQNPRSRTDMMFDPPALPFANIRFDFNFTAGNRMSLNLSTLNQVDSIPDIDSLLKVIKQDLLLFKDSLNEPLESRRVDYITSTYKRIRIQRFPQQGQVYSINGKDITQLKVEQDTLKIILFTRSKVIPHSLFQPANQYTMTFYLNNLSDIEKLDIEKLNTTLDVLRRELGILKGKRERYTSVKYYALYDITTQKKLIPGASRYIGRKRYTFDAYAQASVQYIRGEFSPGAAFGGNLTIRKSENSESSWRLYWEPLFFFSRDLNNQVKTDVNHFISFKHRAESNWKSDTREIHFVQNISVGYLIHREGNWFEKNTIKFSLPTGIEYKSIALEPEFVFNNFFKNFSPSIKLVAIFE